ncbi:hypothetical protein M0813_00335 [Anaeramoeba flamelloides]|uniref:DNA endonuclease activator Ctp1 C-terminal domain-containing protein n=1 Tax=Anaeramoeba flamelloides TaxID=1746091 RepID=A0ABQ8YA18_9EUKA|nr:hypothetical protein M0813_00335 [Anaeramoeba flamelloides]
MTFQEILKQLYSSHSQETKKLQSYIAELEKELDLHEKHCKKLETKNHQLQALVIQESFGVSQNKKKFIQNSQTKETNSQSTIKTNHQDHFNTKEMNKSNFVSNLEESIKSNIDLEFEETQYLEETQPKSNMENNKIEKKDLNLVNEELKNDMETELIIKEKNHKRNNKIEKEKKEQTKIIKSKSSSYNGLLPKSLIKKTKEKNHSSRNKEMDVNFDKTQPPFDKDSNLLEKEKEKETNEKQLKAKEKKSSKENKNKLLHTKPRLSTKKKKRICSQCQFNKTFILPESDDDFDFDSSSELSDEYFSYQLHKKKGFGNHRKQKPMNINPPYDL